MGIQKMPSQVKKTQTQTTSTKNSGKKIKTNFGTYIVRVQKKADAKVRISKTALQTVDGMISNLIEEFGTIIAELKRKTKKSTLAVNDIVAAIKLSAKTENLLNTVLKKEPTQ